MNVSPNKPKRMAYVIGDKVTHPKSGIAGIVFQGRDSKRIRFLCQYCEKEFSLRTDEWKSHSCRFCSRKCYDDDRADNHTVVITCQRPGCRKKKRIRKSRKARDGGKYCSNRCWNIVRKDYGVKLKNSWPDHHKEKVKEFYGDMPISKLARSVGKSEGAVHEMAKRMGFRLHKEGTKWIDKDLEWLRDNAHRPKAFLKRHLGRSWCAVEHRISMMRVIRKDAGDWWTATEVGMIMGVAAVTVVNWIKKRGLRARYSTEYRAQGNWLIHPVTLRKFLISRPDVFDLKKVDQISFMDLMGPGGHGTEPSGGWWVPEKEKPNSYSPYAGGIYASSGKRNGPR